jgi:hypothetical protein
MACIAIYPGALEKQCLPKALGNACCPARRALGALHTTTAEWSDVILVTESARIGLGSKVHVMWAVFSGTAPLGELRHGTE